MPFAELNGIRLYYEEHGHGPAIIFAHGAGGNHLSWWQQVAFFQDSYRCITFDHRAFGRSLDETAQGRVQFGADVIALADYLGIEQFFLVAQSMGGRTAAGVIRRAPERLPGVVFAGSTAGSTNDDVRALQQEYSRSLPPGTTLLTRALWPEYVHRNPEMAFLYRQIQRLNPKRPADFLAAPPGFRGSFTAFIADSEVPVLFLVGEHDAVTPAHIVEKAAGLVRNAEYQVIPAAGHSAYFERPREFNEAVMTFVRTLEAHEPAPQSEALSEA